MAGGGGDDDLNLTAFIDMMATLIAFLLMTAAWLQLESLSTNVENVTSSDSPAPENNEKKTQLAITILQNQIEVAEDQNIQKFPITTTPEGQLDLTQVRAVLAQWRTKYPDKKDVILNTENEVPYKHMIVTFDALVGEGFPDVGVNTQ